MGFHHFLPSPTATPTSSMPFPLSWRPCCHIRSAGPDHSTHLLTSGSNWHWAIMQKETFTSILRALPKATQRKHPMMTKKQKDSIIVSWCSTALWFRVISLIIKDIGTETFGYFPGIAWQLKENTHTDVTLQYHMCSWGKGEGNVNNTHVTSQLPGKDAGRGSPQGNLPLKIIA